MKKEFDALIAGRRSIRRYRPEALSAAVVAELVRGAQWAPSPSNSQPVRFVVLKSASARERLRRAMEDGRERLLAELKAAKGDAHTRNRIKVYYRYATFMLDAPVLLAVGARSDALGFSARLAGAGLNVDAHRARRDLDLSVGAAVQILLLKAHAMGLGGCVLTTPLVLAPDMARLLGLDNMEIHCCVSLGRPAQTPQAPERLPLETVLCEL